MFKHLMGYQLASFRIKLFDTDASMVQVGHYAEHG